MPSHDASSRRPGTVFAIALALLAHPGIGYAEDPAHDQHAPAEHAGGEHTTPAEHGEALAEHGAAAHEPPFSVDLTAVIGHYAPKGGAEDATVSATLLSGVYKLGHHDLLTLLVPMLFGTAHLEGKETQSKAGLGALALAYTHQLELAEHTELPVELLVSAPTESGDALAEGESTRTRALFDEAAAAVRAYEDDEMFLPHRLAVVPKVELEQGLGRLKLSAYGKLPILFRVGGQKSGPEGTANDVAMDATFDVQAAYDAWKAGHDSLSVGARVITNVFLKEVVEVPGEEPSQVQVALEPRLRVRLGAFHARLGVIVPLGGRLADASVFGVRVGGGVAF